MKKIMLQFMSITTLILGLSILVESVQAQDFYDRSNRERRQQDWRRGYGDGYDCRSIEENVVDKLCQLVKEARPRTGGRNHGAQSTCDLARTQAREGIPSFLAGVADGDWNSHGLRHVSVRDQVALENEARAALTCFSGRSDSFARDTHADSERYHAEQERLAREQSNSEE